MAVVTKNVEANSLGSNNPNQSRLILTTHAMLKSRTLKKSFTKASEFYFQGKPRGLRIADEGLYRAEHIHLDRDDTFQVVKPLRPYFPEWVEALEKFVNRLYNLEANTTVRFPIRFGKGRQFSFIANHRAQLSNEQNNTLGQITAARGRMLRVAVSNKYGRTLIGMGNPLPADIGPLFIFDASARVVENYKLWADNEPRLEIMPPLNRKYENLTVHWWKKASGRDY